MSGLLVSKSALQAAATAANPDAPSQPSALGVDDLALLSRLLEVPDPDDFLDAVHADAARSGASATKRERCDCSSLSVEPRAKRPRTTSPVSAKPKPQSQRQKEEIAMLKEQAEELSAQLAALLEHKRQREAIGANAASYLGDGLAGESTATDTAGSSIVRPVTTSAQLWRHIAKRQLAEKKFVEQENVSLREEVDNRWKRMKSLEHSILLAKAGHLRQLSMHSVADEISALVSSF